MKSPSLLLSIVAAVTMTFGFSTSSVQGQADQSGLVRAWGRNYEGQCDIPSGLGLCTQIAGGNAHTIALRQDGVVRAWGNNGVSWADIKTWADTEEPVENLKQYKSRIDQQVFNINQQANAELLWFAKHGNVYLLDEIKKNYPGYFENTPPTFVSPEGLQYIDSPTIRNILDSKQREQRKIDLGQDPEEDKASLLEDKLFKSIAIEQDKPYEWYELGRFFSLGKTNAEKQAEWESSKNIYYLNSEGDLVRSVGLMNSGDKAKVGNMNSTTELLAINSQGQASRAMMAQNTKLLRASPEAWRNIRDSFESVVNDKGLEDVSKTDTILDVMGNILSGGEASFFAPYLSGNTLSEEKRFQEKQPGWDANKILEAIQTKDPDFYTFVISNPNIRNIVASRNAYEFNYYLNQGFTLSALAKDQEVFSKSLNAVGRVFVQGQDMAAASLKSSVMILTMAIGGVAGLLIGTRFSSVAGGCPTNPL